MDLQLLKEMVDQGIFKLPPDPGTQKSTEQAKKSGGEEDNNKNDDQGGQELDQDEEKTPGTVHQQYKRAETSGTSVAPLLVTPDLVLCANLGDSRAIIDGVPLSTDHKPTLPLEEQRIVKAKGEVKCDRVDGELAMSRAFGDFDNGFKAYNQSHITEGNMDINQKRILAQWQKVSPFPEVTKQLRMDSNQTVILACDGVWDVMSNKECNDFLQKRCIHESPDIEWIAESVLDVCLKKESKDNMTILIGLLPSQGTSTDGSDLKRRKVE